MSQYNPTIIKMLSLGLSATPVSSAADALFTSVLLGEREGDPGTSEDQDGLGGFAKWFLEENRKRLARAFEKVAAWCLWHQLEYVFTP